MTKSIYIWFRLFGVTNFCTVLCSTFSAFAQVIPDNTLPNNSQVGIEGNITKIEGGTTAGNNLFHSFGKFGISTGNEAHFNNAVDISNIITRVTGKSISNINGLIKANGTANLFLINPNGIVFGENAKLDIGGSFVGSTAESIKFPDDIEFSAVNPDSKPLLSVNVPLGLQYGMNPGNIIFKGQGEPKRETPEVFEPKFGLQVPANKTLALVGGNVLLEGATLKADSGKIELGSVTGEGFVNITPAEKGFSFGFDKLDNFGDIRLSENTAVDASGNGAGDARITGKNVTITNNSVISSTQTGTKKSAGISINATEQVEINGKNDSENFTYNTGLYANNVSGNATEETSNIRINTPQLIVRDGATVATKVWNAGKGGDIDIQANNFKIESGGIVNASTNSSGDGGDLNIDAENVRVSSVSSDDIPSFLSVSVEQDSTGNAGNLNINSDNLLINDGAFLFAGTNGKGNGGDMTINATSTVEITGQGGNENQFSSGLFVTGENSSTGDSGSLTINAKQMIVRDGAFVNASNNSQGNAGGLNISTDSLEIRNNARFFTGRVTEGREVEDLTIKTNNLIVEGGSSVRAGTSGKNGNLNIEAQDIQVIGTGNNGNTPTSLTVSTQKDSILDGGDLNIKTKRILIKDGAYISTSTSWEGDGGNLNIDAEDVQVIGKGGENPGNNNQPYVSGLFATTEAPSTGDAGKLTINTQRMVVQDGGFVSVGTNSNNGNGGNLNINAADSLQIQNGSFIVSATNGEGTGGNLNIVTNNLLVEDGASIDATSNKFAQGNAGNLAIDSDTINVRNEGTISVGSFGSGNAGILTLNARSINLDNKALLDASTGSADSNSEQATIGINSQELIMRRGSNIFTNASGENVVGGNINIDTDFLIANENSDISANSENFRGGNVRIDAEGIFGTQFRPQLTPRSDITATGATSDLSGNVEIITPQTDPTSGSIRFPTIPVDTEIADACSTPGYAQSSFTITGTGSLPPSPFEPLSGRLNQTKLATLDEIGIKTQARRRIKKEPIKQIVEAQGWVRTEDGKIILVAYNPQNQNFQTRNNYSNCNL